MAALFLPAHGKCIRFHTNDRTEDLEAIPGLPEEGIGVILLTDWDAPGAIVPLDFNTARFEKSKDVEWIREVWYVTDHDPIDYDPDRGRWDLANADHIDMCLGHVYLYYTPEECIDDLAAIYAPARLLRRLSASGEEDVRRLARVVLTGDREALFLLADALEEKHDKDAPAVRALADAEPKPKKKRRSRKQPAPALGGTASAEEGVAPGGPLPTGAPAVASRVKQEVVLIGGFPSAGKTSLAREYVERGYARLNRDEQGGKLENLIGPLEELLAAGQAVVLDNTFPTRASREGFVRAAKRAGVTVRFVLLDAGLEEAQFNMCLRMLERCGKVLHPDDHKNAPYKGEASLYPVAVLYKYKNEFQPAEKSEGFDEVEKVEFRRRYPAEWVHKAVIFDFDGTLRRHEGKEKFPVSPAEVRALVERAPKIREYAAKGYLLLGASNQSGIAKGKLSAADAEACFQETLRQLGLEFAEVMYCPHKVPPISCYCRKPGPGMGVELIVRHRLDPRQCIYVGDAGTDRSFARRCGFQFVEQGEFFA